MLARDKITAKTPQSKRENSVSRSHTTYSSQSINSPVDQILFLQRTIGNQAVEKLFKSGVIQAKLKISQPNDTYEQEADKVADEVMRMPDKQHIADSSLRSIAYGHSSSAIGNKPYAISHTPKLKITPLVQRQVEEEEKEILQTKKVSSQIPKVTPELEPQINAIRGGGQPLPKSLRNYFEPRFGYDFSQVRVHTDTRAAQSAETLYAQAFTLGRNIVFGPREYAPETGAGRRLLAHELTHTIQQNRTGAGARTGIVQRQIQPEDVSEEMVGRFFEVTGSFTSGAIQVHSGNPVEVVAWSNVSTTARVQLRTPLLHAFTPFDIPKRLLRPIRPASGLAPYSAGVQEQVRAIERGEQRIAEERARRGGPRPGEIPRLEALQQNRERLLNRRLIQETMFNRFDPIIEQWVSYYNRQFGFMGRRAAEALDPNLVKSMLFQESQMGTAGQHLEIAPLGGSISHPVRSRFNIGQVIDSSGVALLTMMEEMEPTLLDTYHLRSLRSDLSAAQTELARLRRLRTRTADQETRMAELETLSQRSWEVFIWGYRAPGETLGFRAAVDDFFDIGTGLPPRNMDYDFWIRTAVRWLFEKRQSVRSWAEAIRAYNGSGQSARDYRDAVRQRTQQAQQEQKRGGTFTPSGI
jgi:hypothetical protein